MDWIFISGRYHYLQRILYMPASCPHKKGRILLAQPQLIRISKTILIFSLCFCFCLWKNFINHSKLLEYGLLCMQSYCNWWLNISKSYSLCPILQLVASRLDLKYIPTVSRRSRDHHSKFIFTNYTASEHISSLKVWTFISSEIHQWETFQN